MCGTKCVIVVALLAQASNAVRIRKSNISQVPAVAVAAETIFVRVLEANGLRDADWMPGAGFADSQVWCEYGALKKRTITVSHNTKYVKWDRILDMGPYQPGMDIKFNIHDRDLGSAYDYMGGTVVPHASYYPLNATAPKGFEGQLMLSGNTGMLSANGSTSWSTLTVGVEVLSGVLAEAAAAQATVDDSAKNAADLGGPASTYSEHVGQRCVEKTGDYPIQGPNWKNEVEALCNTDALCHGYMIGQGTADWVAKPQLCTAATLTANAAWTAYLKANGTAVVPTVVPGVAPPAAVAPVAGAGPPAAVAPVAGAVPAVGANVSNTTTAAPTR